MKIFTMIAPLTFFAAVATAQVGKAGPTSALLTLRGILVDGGCANRSSLSFRQAPETVAATVPAGTPAANAGNTGAVTAKGITVDAQTLESERTDVMPHQAPDMRSRQNDPTCAVTAATHGYALLLGNGRLVNLDQGGNTLAAQAVQSTAGGRAMLNGIGPGVKPKVKVAGRLQGDHVIVNDVEIE